MDRKKAIFYPYPTPRLFPISLWSLRFSRPISRQTFWRSPRERDRSWSTISADIEGIPWFSWTNYNWVSFIMMLINPYLKSLQIFGYHSLKEELSEEFYAGAVCRFRVRPVHVGQRPRADTESTWRTKKLDNNFSWTVNVVLTSEPAHHSTRWVVVPRLRLGQRGSETEIPWITQRYERMFKK